MNDFDSVVARIIPGGLWSDRVEAVQVNIGRYCCLACRHCHLDCSPRRMEFMSWDNMKKVFGVLEALSCRSVDVTGGSPELHPLFPAFVDALVRICPTVQVRTNLVALDQAGRGDMLEFLRERCVNLVGSLPCYTEETVDGQRGSGVYRKSIEVIRMLNALGYGKSEGLSLNLVYNPAGPFLPAKQADLEAAYRRELKGRFGISFNRLHVLTNMPVGRFRRELEKDGRLDEYMNVLKRHFNPGTLEGLMCRTQVSVDWDGTIHDCDFNLALGLGTRHRIPCTLERFDRRLLERRRIKTGSHCFGCTAGQGSSCSGSLQ